MTAPQYDPYPTGLVWRESRGPQVWKGVGMGDAFRADLNYWTRLPAQAAFYRGVSSVQALVCRQFAAGGQPPSAPLAKAQLSPFYADWPPPAAARAALGWTAYLEFAQQTRERAPKLVEHLKLAAKDRAPDPVVALCAAAVAGRLHVEELRRVHGLSVIDDYRLFLANLQSLRFSRVAEVVQACVLYGDLLPSYDTLSLHPAAALLLDAATAACAPLLALLPETPVGSLVELGVEWVRELASALRPLLRAGPRPEAPALGARRGQNPRDTVSPLDLPAAPTFGALDPVIQAGVPGLLDPDADVFESESLAPSAEYQRLANAVRSASGQETSWEDPRRDLLERTVAGAAFAEGPIQGTATDGREVKVDLGDGQTRSGEVFDRPAPLSDDMPAVEALRALARPVTDSLRRALHPNLEETYERDRLRTGGALDPARLPLAGASEAIYRRHRTLLRPDPRGRAVLLIACDASGSLDENQMTLAKLLTAAWLEATRGRDVEVLAGVYHSGRVRGGVEGTLVQWMVHPAKTAATSRRDAVRAVASLPRSGTGCQRDAVSLAYMTDEARKLAKGGVVYRIVLTDTEFNNSFRCGQSGLEEVQSLFRRQRQEFGKLLHTTLVALGASKAAELEDLVEKVVLVPRDAAPEQMAREIGTYVAACVRETRRGLARAAQPARNPRRKGKKT